VSLVEKQSYKSEMT